MTIPHEVREFLVKQAEVGAHDSFRASTVNALDEQLQGIEYNKENSPYHYLLNPFVSGPLTELVARLQRRVSGSGTTGSVLPQAGSLAGTLAGAAGMPLGNVGKVVGSIPGAIMGDDEAKTETTDLVEGDKDFEKYDQEKQRDNDSKEKAERREAKKERKKEANAQILLSGLLEKQAELGPWDTERGSKMRAFDKAIQGMEYNRNENPGNYYLNPVVPGPISELITRLLRRSNATEVGTALGPLASPVTAFWGDDKAKAETAALVNDPVNDPDGKYEEHDQQDIRDRDADKASGKDKEPEEAEKSSSLAMDLAARYLTDNVEQQS